MSEKIYISQEGLDKLKEELNDLKTRGRKEAAKAIAEAREKGDLSENAEYDAAKEAQGLLELKISKLETNVGNAVVLDESKLDTSKVIVLSKVTIKNIANGFKDTYHIVSESEANVKEKKISVKSPIGSGLLGKKVGDVAEITLPNGNKINFEVLDISV